MISPGDVTYLLAILLLTGARLIPGSWRIRVFDKASPLSARLLYAANVRPAQVIRRNLEVLFGADRLPHLIEVDVRRQLSVTIWNSLVMSALPTLTRQQVVNLVPVEGASVLDDFLAAGHPVLILGYHFGVQPLIVAAVLHARGYPIHAITHIRRTPATASKLACLYFQRLRHIGNQFPVIDPREGVQREMLDILKNKECQYITPDYMLPEEERQPKSAFEVPVDFLGRRAYLRTGGLRLAKRYKAKVVTVLSVPNEGDGRRLIVEPLVLPTPGRKPDQLQQDLQACMNRFEAQLLAHPHLWLDLRRDDLLQRLKAIPPVQSSDCGSNQDSANDGN